jgi:hypothetical protein
MLTILVPVLLTFCGMLIVSLVTVLLVWYLMQLIALVPVVTLLTVLSLAILALIALKYRALMVLIQVKQLVNAFLLFNGIGILQV